jgi:hypothetical protein
MRDAKTGRVQVRRACIERSFIVSGLQMFLLRERIRAATRTDLTPNCKVLKKFINIYKYEQ